MKTENQETFTRQYHLVHNELEKYCKALFYNKDDAKDLMCEALAIAFEKYETLKDPSKFKFYLFAICSRLFKKKITRRKMHEDLHHPALQNLTAEGEDPSGRSDIRFLYQALDKLPENEKEIIALFELSGFSLNEISEIKQMNLSTVKTHLSRGRKRLISLLNPESKSVKENSKP